MSYWLGSGVDVIEMELTIYCPTCDEERDEVTCYAEGATATGECPICRTEVEVEV
jgi:hypothetical protein